MDDTSARPLSEHPNVNVSSCGACGSLQPGFSVWRFWSRCTYYHIPLCVIFLAFRSDAPLCAFLTQQRKVKLNRNISVVVVKQCKFFDGIVKNCGCLSFNESIWGFDTVHNTFTVTHFNRMDSVGITVTAVGILKVKNNPGRCRFYPPLGSAAALFGLEAEMEGKMVFSRVGDLKYVCVWVIPVHYKPPLHSS